MLDELIEEEKRGNEALSKLKIKKLGNDLTTKSNLYLSVIEAILLQEVFLEECNPYIVITFQVDEQEILVKKRVRRYQIKIVNIN